MQEIFITITDFPEGVKELPIASYFIETNKKSPLSSVGEWLQTMDSDTLAYISKGFEQLRYENGEDNLEHLSDISIDVMVTAFLIMCWEKNQESISEKEYNTYMANLDVMVTIESLRRKGIIEITGNGKVTEENTFVKLTEMGKLVTDKMSDNDKDSVEKRG